MNKYLASSIIKEIDYGYISYGNLHSNDDEGLKLIADALKKQIPKKPQEYTLYTESDEEVHYEGCPSCRAILNKSHYFLKICHCGQKLEV